MYIIVFICRIITNKNLDKALIHRLLYKNVAICKYSSMEDMLLYQGVIAFELFTNTKANSKLIEAMRIGLKES